MILDERTAILADIEQSDSEATQTNPLLTPQARGAGAFAPRPKRRRLWDFSSIAWSCVEWIRLSVKLPVGSSEKLAGGRLNSSHSRG